MSSPAALTVTSSVADAGWIKLVDVNDYFVVSIVVDAVIVLSNSVEFVFCSSWTSLGYEVLAVFDSS